MKITLFTSNNYRHNYLINLISSYCDELFVVQECNTIFPGAIPSIYQVSEITLNYFKNVDKAQIKLFGTSYIQNKNKNIRILPLKMGDLNKCTPQLLKDFLESDLYVVFGSSYIKNDLIQFLVNKKAINIHMGVSPFYRGSNCNFWSLYDDNPHLTGATIHLLSKGLDSGPILYHAMSKLKEDPFEYTMSTVKSAFYSIIEKINEKSIFDYKPVAQNSSQEIRYSRNSDFNDKIIEEFNNKKINLNSKEFDITLLKEPYFYKNID